MSIQTTTCPKCGKPALRGMYHEACAPAELTSGLPRVEISGNTIRVAAGADINALMAMLFDGGPAIVHRQQFDWTSPDGTNAITFDVSSMLDAIAKGELAHTKCLAEVDHKFALRWPPLRDLNRARLDAFLAEPGFSKLKEPVLFIEHGDGTHLLIDGSHRYWLHHEAEAKYIRAHIVAYGDWQRYAHFHTDNGIVAAVKDKP